jgi:hypothetical protein
MQPSLICPHCGKPAKSLLGKFNDSGFRPTTCSACGESIQLKTGWPFTLISLLWLLPSVFFHPLWLRLSVLVTTVTILAIFRTLHFRYAKQHPPITF